MTLAHRFLTPLFVGALTLVPSAAVAADGTWTEVHGYYFIDFLVFVFLTCFVNETSQTLAECFLIIFKLLGGFLDLLE